MKARHPRCAEVVCDVLKETGMLQLYYTMLWHASTSRQIDSPPFVNNSSYSVI